MQLIQRIAQLLGELFDPVILDTTAFNNKIMTTKAAAYFVHKVTGCLTKKYWALVQAFAQSVCPVLTKSSANFLCGFVLLHGCLCRCSAEGVLWLFVKLRCDASDKCPHPSCQKRAPVTDIVSVSGILDPTIFSNVLINSVDFIPVFSNPWTSPLSLSSLTSISHCRLVSCLSFCFLLSFYYLLFPVWG